MTRIYRTCLIGCGRQGAMIDEQVKARANSNPFIPISHAAAYVACARTDLVAVCDRSRAAAEEARVLHSVPRAYADYREMIRKEEPDIVSIATKPSLHAEMLAFAAENGVKGVFCEKPLCNSMRESDVMLDACELHGLKYTHGTQRRYQAMHRNLRAMVEAGEIGEMQAIVAHCGEDAAQQGHTHAVDMVLFLAGDGEVDFVQGSAAAGEEDWDGDCLKVDAPISMGYIRFRNGIHAYLVASSGYEFEVSGTRGKLRTLNNGMGYSWRKADESGVLQDATGPVVPLESGTLRGVEDLVRALDHDTDTQCGIHVARRGLEIVLGLIESHRRGGARVALPLTNRDLAVMSDY